jgi:acyl-CoA thioester hydrolase
MIFERRINYYETDTMGIVHHSNYIRFMEEARIAFLDSIGLPYKKIEDSKIMIPVLGVNCEYKIPAKFDDIILIELHITEYTSVKMTLNYKITNKENGKLLVSGETKHCFTDITLKPISLKKLQPEMHKLFDKAITSC